ncbi:MAG: EAL domain-containing protein [Nitrospiria bacterium]
MIVDTHAKKHKDTTGCEKRKKFLSLKWKVLLWASLVLLIVNVSFPFLHYRHLIGQFDGHRNAVHKQYAREFEKRLKQTADHLQRLGSLIPSLDGMRAALASHENDKIAAVFDPHWTRIRSNNRIDTLRFYSDAGKTLASWGASGALAEQDPLIKTWIDKAAASGHPLMALLCRRECTQYVLTPIRLDGKTAGTLLLGTALSRMIADFQQISGIDIGLIVKSGGNHTPSAHPSAGIPSWNAHVASLTHEGHTLPLLKWIAGQNPSLDPAKTSRKTTFNQIDYDIGFIPLHGLADGGSGHLVIIGDISEALSKIRIVTKRSLLAGFLSLLFSEVFLFMILSNPTTRLVRIAETLPLLAQSAFGYVRSSVRWKEKHWRTDEIDILGNTAISLSYQLEKLENEVQKRTKTLADRMDELSTEKAFVSNLLDTARVIILTQNDTGEIVMVNQHGSDLTGYPQGDLSGRKFTSLLAPDQTSPDLAEALIKLVDGKQGDLSHESVISCRDRSTRHVLWFHSHLARKDAKDPAILSVGLDFTARKRAELRLSWLADHDSLTGLFNRRRFQSETDRILAEAKRYNRSGALLVFDLDQFKYVNDTRGHHAGDMLLKAVADHLSRIVRSTDFVSRLGGDEFALVISEVGQEGAVQVAEKIIEFLNEVEIPVFEDCYKVSASIGIALFPKHGTTVQKLLSNADIAMVQAKDRERGNWHIFSGQEPIKARMQKRAYWEDKIKQALDKDDFVLHFQPVQDVSNGSTYFYEALLRMHHDEKLILPGAFIPIAETCGLIFPIDHMVLNKVIAAQAHLASKGVQTTFAINLSGHAFNDRELLPHLEKTLRHSGADPKSIILEITETAAVSDLVAACTLMEEIKALGCRFALDDFGMGFSSFNYMKQLPVDFVKIGDTFIRDLSTHADDQIFVKSLSEVTRGLGKKTVAEGVEDEKTLALLREYAVDFAQGYHVGKPAPTIV